MKKTLLQLTQDILSDMSSDPVNSISDTEESLQVATIIQNVYYLLFSNREIPELKQLIELDALADTAHPNYLQLPANVDKIDWIKYDFQTNSALDYRDIRYLCVKDFIDNAMQRVNADGAVMITDFQGPRYPILTDTSPRYWTTFDDNYLVFDSYDSVLDTTLQSSKTMCWGQIEDTWSAIDDFIPRIDANFFPMLQAEATSTCWLKLKGDKSVKDEQNSRTQLIRSQNDTWRERDPQKRLGPNYGRRGISGSRRY